MLLACALLLAVAYVIFFTDLFRKERVQIIVKLSPGRASAIPRPSDWTPVYPVTFRLNKAYQFKTIEVVNAAEFATNKHILPMWHMVSDSNSVPQQTIVYGAPKIQGMHSAVPRARPQPLEAGVQYTLMLETSKWKAETNFVAKEYVAKRR